MNKNTLYYYQRTEIIIHRFHTNNFHAGAQATNAVYLELVTHLTSEAFLNALRRFTSRRGFVKQLFSDNATNFKPSEKELKEMYNVFKNKDFHNKISCTLANNISWSFIQPSSPNFGGLLEAGIKSVKYHIKYDVRRDVL
jgi:hypothetical protein